MITIRKIDENSPDGRSIPTRHRVWASIFTHDASSTRCSCREMVHVQIGMSSAGPFCKRQAGCHQTIVRPILTRADAGLCQRLHALVPRSWPPFHDPSSRSRDASWSRTPCDVFLFRLAGKGLETSNGSSHPDPATPRERNLSVQKSRVHAHGRTHERANMTRGPAD